MTLGRKIAVALILTAAFVGLLASMRSFHVWLVWAIVMGLLFIGQRLLFAGTEDSETASED
jgi:predicted tellurium resistance membrane protein TerC